MTKNKRTKGKIEEPYLILVYGPPGCGKSTFASESPKPVFLDLESGTKNLDVERAGDMETYEDFIIELEDLNSDKSVGTVVIDTADHLENLMIKSILKKHEVEAIGDIPHGKGYDLLKTEWHSLFAKLDSIKKNKNVIILAHSEIVTFTDPGLILPYDRHQIRLSKKGLATVKDKVDAILFMNFDGVSAKSKGEQKAKGLGGEHRIMFTQYRLSHEGKNRFGLPYKIQLPISGMFKAFHNAVQEANPKSPEILIAEIEGLMTKLSDETLKLKANEQFEAAKKIVDINKLVAIKNRLLEVTQE